MIYFVRFSRQERPSRRTKGGVLPLNGTNCERGDCGGCQISALRGLVVRARGHKAQCQRHVGTILTSATGDLGVLEPSDMSSKIAIELRGPTAGSWVCLAEIRAILIDINSRLLKDWL